MNHVAITTTCPRCARPVVAEPDPVTGTVACGDCGARFDPRQDATAIGGAEPLDVWQPQAGERIGGYQLEHEIGRGGMSAVWQARQDSLARPVAIKILHAHLAADDELRRRFAREAEAMVQLDHPHIVPVIDRGEHRGRPFLVMGLVGAHTLRAELGGDDGGRRLAPARVAELADQCLAALAHAHARGLVHRDIKPDNLLLDAQDRLRVADFGIAQVARGIDGDTLTQLTGTRVVMGTVAYMAPEQGEATRSVDHRCDLYSLGVICYEALRGHRPVGRFEDPAEGLDLEPAEAEGWNRFVLALLEREPARRPADAAAARALLAAVPDGPAAIEPERMDEAETRGAAVDRAAQAVAGAMAAARAAVDRAAGQADAAWNRQRAEAHATTAAMNAAPEVDHGHPHGRRLLRPGDERWIAGVCGGLGRWLGIHPDWVRLAAVLSAVVLGPGLLVTLGCYVVGAVAIPPCRSDRYRPRPLNHGLPQRPDGWFLGVCQLLGDATTLPPALWRLIAVITLPVGSWVPYLALGILLPRRPEHDHWRSRMVHHQRAWTDGEDPPVPAAAAASSLLHRGRAFRFWSLLALGCAAGAVVLDASVPQVGHELLWWLSGGGILAALLSSPRDDGRPRAGSLGGLLGAIALGELVLLGAGVQGQPVAGPAQALALLGGATLLGALLARRNAAVLLGSAAVVGVGAAALLAATGPGTDPLGLGWERLMPLVGVVGTAAAYALLRPLLTREDETRFSLPALVVGFAALGAIGIGVAAAPPLPAGFALDAGQPGLLLGLAVAASVIVAVGRHVALRVVLALILALLFAGAFVLGTPARTGAMAPDAAESTSLPSPHLDRTQPDPGGTAPHTEPGRTLGGSAFIDGRLQGAPRP